VGWREQTVGGKGGVVWMIDTRKKFDCKLKKRKKHKGRNADDLANKE